MAEFNEDLDKKIREKYAPRWVTFADIVPRTQKFLMPGIPENNITLIVSDGGTGKGFFTCHLAAAVTTGAASIFDTEPAEREPGRVMLINAEDSNDCVIVQRLELAGADMALVETLNENEAIPTIEEIVERVELTDPKLLILDPLQSFIPKGVKMSLRNDMRKLMEPLQIVAKKSNCAVVIVMHTNKTFGTSGRNRIADSSDMWDIARSAFLMGEVYDGEFTKYISHEKNNYGKQNPTILYRIDDFGIYKVGETSKKDHDFVAEHNKQIGGRPPTKKDEAKAFILETLQDKKGGITNKDLTLLTEQNGISQRTMERARRELVQAGNIKIISAGQSGFYKCTYTLNDE